MVLRLRGGGGLMVDMGIAVGGLIKQTIKQDRYEPTSWETDCTAIFNVQILNSEHYRELLGKTPPKSPVTAATYAGYGFP